MDNQNIPKVFISYSHEDEEWKNFIRKFFMASNSFEMWDDRDIQLGDKWLVEIEKALSEADIAILLISVDFLISPFIQNKEVPFFLDRAEKNKLKIIPIMLSSCPWENYGWLASLQGSPNNFTPLDTSVRHNSSFQKCPDTREEINKIVMRIDREYKKEEERSHQLEINDDTNTIIPIDASEEKENFFLNKDNLVEKIMGNTIKVDLKQKTLYIGKYPVTFEEYDFFLSENDNVSKFFCSYTSQEKAKYPIVNISWNEAEKYCLWLKRKTNREVRLLSTNEWNHIVDRVIEMDRSEECITYSCTELQEIDSVKDDCWGLNDIIGNVSEWCWNGKDNKKYIKGIAFYDSLNNIKESKLTRKSTKQPYIGFRIAFSIKKEKIFDKI